MNYIKHSYIKIAKEKLKKKHLTATQNHTAKMHSMTSNPIRFSVQNRTNSLLAHWIPPPSPQKLLNPIEFIKNNKIAFRQRYSHQMKERVPSVTVLNSPFVRLLGFRTSIQVCIFRSFKTLSMILARLSRHFFLKVPAVRITHIYAKKTGKYRQMKLVLFFCPKGPLQHVGKVTVYV